MSNLFGQFGAIANSSEQILDDDTGYELAKQIQH